MVFYIWSSGEGGMDFGLFMSSTDPLHEGVVDSGHFGPPTNPFHEGYVDYGLRKSST